MSNLKQLTDEQLVAEVERLARCERAASATLVAHLAELNARRIDARAGYSSLFLYCRDALRLSESEAYDRMKAAKVARRYPPVVSLLETRMISLTTIRLLAPYLTRGNQEELFAEACGKGKRQVLEMLARRFPQPDKGAVLRKLPAPAAGRPAAAPGTVSPSPGPAACPTPLAPTAPAAAALTAPAASATALAPVVIRPVAPERYRIAFTADGDTRELLELARDLLRHAVPSGDPAEIFARSLKALVEDLVRRKFAAASRPRRSRSAGHDARHIPAEVKRAVYLRDRGLCAYASPLGHRCGERAFLEFHHLTPVAAGGTATVDNIQLRCRVHNALEAELYFGATRVSEAGPAYTVSAMTRFRSGTKTDLGQRNEAWIGGTDDDVVLGRAKLREQVHHRECRSSRQGSPRMW